MSKKLPKAIRPNVTHRGGPEAQSRVAEPLPEAKRPAKPQQVSSIAPEDLVATDIDAAERKGRARKLVERFSLYSGVAGLLPVPVVDIAAVGGVQLQMLAAHFATLRHSVFEKSRQGDCGEFCRNDDTREHRTGRCQHGQERACRRNGNRRDHRTGFVRRCHLRDWNDFRRALCPRRDAARFRAT